MKRIKLIFAIFVLWTLLGTLSKVVFLIVYRDTIGDMGIENVAGVLFNGLRLDIAIAGYMTVAYSLLLTVHVWYRGMVWQCLWRGFTFVAAFAFMLAVVSNLGLYGYWGFPLDDTSLLYIKTSPADAMASMTLGQMIGAPLIIAVLTYAAYRLVMEVTGRVLGKGKPQQGVAASIMQSVALLVIMALQILPIRGSIATGTNHTGSVYFSSNMRLNHAAVNPVFSFVEAALHREEIGTKYRFMEPAEADRLFAEMCHTQLRTDSLKVAKGTNVVFVILESFSKYIMEEKGHVKGVVPNLERLSREGLYFDNFYVNSVRTDRAMVAVLSALPAQTTMSIMDIPNKSVQLPSVARSLVQNGYSTAFYYGGDANYSNMRSYLIGTGYEKVVSDRDFPKKELTGKWGAADEFVYARMMKDIRGYNGEKPFFFTMLTSSSHEPFDVPNYKSSFKEPQLNAFSYADKCLGRFIDELKKEKCWDNTLVVIVPDHLGAYPSPIDNYQLWRYESPLIMTGGALPMKGRCSTVGCQTDIAATVLGMLDVKHSDFIYSKDILDAAAPHFAFFTCQDAMGMVTDSTQVIYDNDAQSATLKNGSNADHTEKLSKAYLQKLYDFIDGL